MTLGEGKEKVLMLLDEYSSGGEITTDEDIMNKMNRFFDIAQKDMANYKHIIRTVEIELAAGQSLFPLPGDCMRPFRIWRKGVLTNRYPIVSGSILTDGSESGTLLLEYFALPATINNDTPDDYEFEVSEDAANCLPFFVAAQQLIVDLVVDYSALYGLYNAMRGALDVSLPSSGGGVRQTLYRR